MGKTGFARPIGRARPAQDSSVSLDYRRVTQTDIISELPGKIILKNAKRYASHIVRAPVDGYPTPILKNENLSGLKTPGLDMEARRALGGQRGRSRRPEPQPDLRHRRQAAFSGARPMRERRRVSGLHIA